MVVGGPNVNVVSDTFSEMPFPRIKLPRPSHENAREQQSQSKRFLSRASLHMAKFTLSFREAHKSNSHHTIETLNLN